MRPEDPGARLPWNPASPPSLAARASLQTVFEKRTLRDHGPAAAVGFEAQGIRAGDFEAFSEVTTHQIESFKAMRLEKIKAKGNPFKLLKMANAILLRDGPHGRSCSRTSFRKRR